MLRSVTEWGLRNTPNGRDSPVTAHSAREPRRILSSDSRRATLGRLRMPDDPRHAARGIREGCATSDIADRGGRSCGGDKPGRERRSDSGGRCGSGFIARAPRASGRGLRAHSPGDSGGQRDRARTGGGRQREHRTRGRRYDPRGHAANREACRRHDRHRHAVASTGRGGHRHDPAHSARGRRPREPGRPAVRHVGAPGPRPVGTVPARDHRGRAARSTRPGCHAHGSLGLARRTARALRRARARARGRRTAAKRPRPWCPDLARARGEAGVG